MVQFAQTGANQWGVYKEGRLVGRIDRRQGIREDTYAYTHAVSWLAGQRRSKLSPTYSLDTMKRWVAEMLK